MSDIYSSEEERKTRSSSTVTDVTVEDSDNEVDADESVIGFKIKKKAQKVIFSDTDEEEDEAERRALSPRTRRSIGVFHPNSLTDDESSEIAYSDEDENAKTESSNYSSRLSRSDRKKQIKKKSQRNNIETDSEDEEHSNITSAQSKNSAKESIKDSHTEKQIKNHNATQNKNENLSKSKIKLHQNLHSDNTVSEIEQTSSDSGSDSDFTEKSHSDNENLSKSKTTGNSKKTELENGISTYSNDEETDDYKVEQNKSSDPDDKEIDDSKVEQNESPDRDDEEIDDSKVEQNESPGSDEEIDDSKVEQNESPGPDDEEINASKVDQIESPVSAAEKFHRYTANFNADVGSLLSSTVSEDFVATKEKNCSNNSSSSGEIQMISIKNLPIEISSSEEASNSIKSSPVKISSLPAPQLPAPQKPPRSAKKTPKKANIKYVSKEFYDKEFKKLMELKQELQSAESLAEKIGSNLPDGGRNLYLRCDRLRVDAAIKQSLLDSMRVEGSLSVENEMKKTQILKAPKWEDLSDAVNQVQPAYTGKKGLQTFNTQKVLTVERLKDLHGSLESRPAENEMADTPKGFKIELMPHQRHALKWMQWREKQKPRGGILADDMGLGKTLSLIALVLAAKIRRDDGETDDNSGGSSDSDTEKNSNWNSKGRRTKYNGGTLVVCPASLVHQWANEVERRIKSNRLTVCVHHGQNRDTRPKHLRTYDIVVTTYNIVSREQKTDGALFGLKWRRIILDEAHVIRNHKSQMSLAACDLRGTCRWALTGTPVQNKELDVYALLKFLRCSPFDDISHWKRWIDNKSAGGQERLSALMQTLMLRRTKTSLQERGDLGCLPEKEIELVEVVLDKDEMNVYQKVMAYSRNLFAQFLYQRAERNTDNAFVRDAAQPTYMQKKDPNGAYYKLHEKFKRMHGGQQDVKSHEILTLLLRLRQVCCHPGLIDAMLEGDDVSNLSSDCNSTQPEVDLLDQLERLAIRDVDTSNTDKNGNGHELDDTPTDHALVKASAKVMQRSNPVFDLQRSSSKITKVLNVLENILSTSMDKVIVVSQWSSVLRIIKNQLAFRNIASVTLDGSVPVKNRQGIMNDFNNAYSSNRVLFLSLTAGGVGLNLVGANHMILTDLHWNPQLEAQAQDRIYRVGQKKKVKIYKLMCTGTVEASIRELQEKKLALARGVLDGTKSDKGSKLTIDDLKSLFGM